MNSRVHNLNKNLYGVTWIILVSGKCKICTSEAWITCNFTLIKQSTYYYVLVKSDKKTRLCAYF